MITLFLKYAMRTFNFVPRYTWFVHGMGLNLFSAIKQFSSGCCLQKHFVGSNCVHLTKYRVACKSHYSLVDRHENMSHKMYHGSCICFLGFMFALGFVFTTHDMIQCRVMWQ